MSDKAISTIRDFAKELYSSDGWKWRRLLLFWVIFTLLGGVVFIEVRNSDSAISQQALLASIAAVVTLTSGYVYGAIMDDRDKRRWLPPVADAPGSENHNDQDPPAPDPDPDPCAQK